MEALRLLVTGASGFIGAEVMRQLARGDDDVLGVTRRGPTRDGLVRLDLASDPLAPIREFGPEACLHLAWYTGPDRNHAEAENLRSLQASLRLTQELLRAGCRRLVVAGTGMEATDTVYGTTKRSLHQVGLTLRSISFACAHLFHVYGPSEHEDRVIPLAVRSMLRGEELRLTAGEQVRDFLHVSDVAAALLLVLRAPLVGSIDISAGDHRTVGDAVSLLGARAGRPDLITLGALPYRADEPMTITGDPRKLRELGWAPRLTLEAGLDDCLSQTRPPGNGSGRAGDLAP